MIIQMPVTGELIAPRSGSLDKPVRPINFIKLLPVGLTDFNFQVLNYDFDNGIAEIELTFTQRDEPDAAFEARKKDIETAITALLETHNFDELNELTKEPKLVKKFKK